MYHLHTAMGIDQSKEREDILGASRRLLQRSRQEMGGQELGQQKSDPKEKDQFRTKRQTLET